MSGTLTRDAVTLAMRMHAQQTYGGPHAKVPYYVHLGHVVAVLLRFNHDDPDLIAAGWLHDVLEDTPFTYDDVRDGTNVRVADIVLLLTNGEGRNRRERQQAMYARMGAPSTSVSRRADAVTVKLADRIANVEASILAQDPRLAMYAKEHRGFHQGLDMMGGDQSMWIYLDTILGF